MSWDESLGSFPLICRRFQQAKVSGRLGQAYLLRGDDAEFLERFALGMARIGACQAPDAAGRPCGQCRACRMFDADSYTEMRIIRPQSKSRQITVDAMREYERWIGLSVERGLLKVGIIVEAECMGEEAQNAFLKTLEEPPANTMLLLLTVNARRLLPTIRSRCQTISLLRNKLSYEIAAEKNLYALLGPLKRRAGAALGLKIASRLLGIFSELHKDAEAEAEKNQDHRWDNVEDAKIKKQQEDEQTAKIESEYVRLRDSLLGSIQAWYMQRFLISCGVKADLLPHQEMLRFSDEILAAPPEREEAEHDIRLAEELAQAIRGNVDERLALEVFCLEVSEKNVRF